MTNYYKSQKQALKEADEIINDTLQKGEGVKEAALINEILLKHEVSEKVIKKFLHRYALIRNNVKYEDGVLWLR